MNIFTQPFPRTISKYKITIYFCLHRAYTCKCTVYVIDLNSCKWRNKIRVTYLAGAHRLAMSTMPLMPADLYPASANCLDLRQPLKITGPSGSWGLPESLQIQAASYQRVRAEPPQHAVPLPTSPLRPCPAEPAPGLLTSAAFWASSFFILAFSMLSWASLLFLSPSILFFSPSCLCFSISANFPFTLPEGVTEHSTGLQTSGQRPGTTVPTSSRPVPHLWSWGRRIFPLLLASPLLPHRWRRVVLLSAADHAEERKR